MTAMGTGPEDPASEDFSVWSLGKGSRVNRRKTSSGVPLSGTDEHGNGEAAENVSVGLEMQH